MPTRTASRRARAGQAAVVDARALPGALRLPAIPLWARTLAAVLGGLAVGLSWQPVGWWPLLLIGVPALTVAVSGVRLRRAFWLGGLFGLAMLGVGLSWIRVLGVPIAVGLVVFMSLFIALLGVAVRMVVRLPGWPVWVAACWVLCEFCYSRWPFGGFGWSRLAYAAVDTPLAGYLPLFGVAGVTFTVALVPHLVLWAVTVRSRRVVVGAVAAALAVVLGGLAGTRFQVEPADPGDGTVEVGIVQGNVPGRGIEAMGRARSVTYNHLAETIDLIGRSRLGEAPKPDFVLWPENSTDIDPQRDATTGATVSAAVALADVPILVGAVTEGPGPDERQTTSMWWDPRRGVVATYHKRNLVPFGEWIPFRAQLLPLVPMLQLVGPQSVPGTTPGALTVRLDDGRPLTVGVVICFELAYDATVAEVVRAGADVLTVQSNNATYGGTGQIEQQFAITRARAMETRRDIAVATTDSVSGYIDRTGHVVYRTDEFTAASTVVAMPLRHGLTPAMTAGSWVDRGLALIGVLAVLCAIIVAGRALWERSRRPGDPDPAEPEALGTGGAATERATVRTEGASAADPPDDPGTGPPDPPDGRTARPDPGGRPDPNEPTDSIDPPRGGPDP